MITVKWGNRLEVLADSMFSESDQEKVSTPAEVFKRRQCIVIPNRIMQYWLQHQYLYRDADQAVPRVLTNCEFPLLHVFVNDWLYSMDHPEDKERDPSKHPFCVESMRWRIFDVLQSPEHMRDPRFAALERYVAFGAQNSEREACRLARRRFKLAGRLSPLFDEYTVYRPEMLVRWENGENKDLPDDLKWEPELWRLLTRDTLQNQTYLAAFRRMEKDFLNSNIRERYGRVRVFGLSMMPRVYLVFFDLLSKILPVDFYLFNPCQTEWFEQLTPRVQELAERNLRMEGVEDENIMFEPQNRLLAAQGKGCRDFVAEVLDITGGQSEQGGCFVDPGTDTILHRLQSQILDNTPGQAGELIEADGSIQVHVCHGPMREVEVLRDHLLKWFSTTKGLQPRHVQVQVSDMAKYAPYIDAVFATQAKHAPGTIPYVIADRVLAGESLVAEAFQALLQLTNSRFSAPEVMALLRCGSIGQSFGFAEDEVDAAAAWVEAAGVRWGRDANHRKKVTGLDFTSLTTWRHGLDRLLLGYAFGREDDDQGSCAPGGGGVPLPCDCVEGNDAVLLGQLARFFDCLAHVAEVCSAPRTVAEWADKLDEVVDMFFVSTNETYRDVGVIRGAIESLRKSAGAAGFGGATPGDVVCEFLASHLQGVAGGDELSGNAVVFSALRPGSSASRKIMCMLGMGDGLFPRMDNRPAYDLLRCRRLTGDRSMRIEDRMAWLESVMNARDVFYISYTGHSPLDNQEIPGSVLIQELCEYLSGAMGPGSWRKVEHKLQAFHPDYFDGKADLFSYSAGNCQAARRLIVGSDPNKDKKTEESAESSLSKNKKQGKTTVELEGLIRFFKNPAERYYRDILGVNLKPDLEAALEDSEEFAPGKLTEYKVNQKIVEALVSGGGEKPDAALQSRLSEDGLIPLENWGERWLQKRWETVRDLMGSERKGLGRLGEALQKQAAGRQHMLSVELDPGLSVAGTIMTYNNENNMPTALDFRCVSAKAADRLASWLRHLLACAAGFQEFRFFVEGKEEVEENNFLCFEPIEADEAKHLLKIYVNDYLVGLQAIPPFTPETAYAYVEGRQKQPKKGPVPDEAERHAAGMSGARRAWYSDKDNNQFKDDNDPYFRKTFGADGPFKDEQAFGALAKRLMEPILAGSECHA